MSETIQTSQTPAQLTSLQPLIDDDDVQIDALPMPPRRRSNRRRWITTAIVAVVLLGLIGDGVFYYIQSTAPAPVQYTQSAAAVGNLTLTVSASGPVTPKAEYDMNFSVAGQVSSINVHIGQQVKAGQTLATLKSTSLQDAVVQAQQSVNTAQTTYDDAVNNGASQTQLDSDYNSLLAAQDQLKTAQDNLANTILTAPGNGTVAAINGVVGQSASTSASPAFIVLTDTSSYYINATVNEADIASVKVGQPARFTVSAYSGQTFRATVTAIDTIGQTSSNVVVYPVQLLVNNNSLNGSQFYTGMTATVNITTAQRIGALLISNAALSFPTTALRAGVINRNTLVSALSGSSSTGGAGGTGIGSGTGTGIGTGTGTGVANGQTSQRIVLELRNGKLVPVVVTTGLTNGTYTEILSGLQAGDQVVVSATGGNFSNLSSSSTGTGTGAGGGIRQGGGGIRFTGGN